MLNIFENHYRFIIFDSLLKTQHMSTITLITYMYIVIQIKKKKNEN